MALALRALINEKMRRDALRSGLTGKGRTAHLNVDVASHEDASADQCLRPPLRADDLKARYEERMAMSTHDGHRTLPEAEAIAWREVAAIWYRERGKKISGQLCAGCEAPIANVPHVMVLPHGERAHSTNDRRCILLYGRRWKRQAAEALTELGITTPLAIATEIDRAPP